MKRRGTIGPPLPASARGHCTFITSWAVEMCRAAASEHFLLDHPGGSGMFACTDHASSVATIFRPVDRHPVTAECLHSASEWQVSSPNRPGFCFVPAEDVELLESVREVATTRG